MKLDALILETSSGEYQGNPWKALIGRVDKKLMRFKVVSSLDIEQYMDKEVELTLDLQGSATTSTYVRVVGIQEK